MFTNSGVLGDLFGGVETVGARCFIDREIINGENERKLEMIGALIFVIDEDFEGDLPWRIFSLELAELRVRD